MNYNLDENKMVRNEMEIDQKIVKLIYPRTNNRSTLEFILEKDPNLFLRMHSMKLMVQIKYPKSYVPDSGAGVKLFSDLRIDLDSQSINSSSTKYVKTESFL